MGDLDFSELPVELWSNIFKFLTKQYIHPFIVRYMYEKDIKYMLNNTSVNETSYNVTAYRLYKKYGYEILYKQVCISEHIYRDDPSLVEKFNSGINYNNFSEEFLREFGYVNAIDYASQVYSEELIWQFRRNINASDLHMQVLSDDFILKFYKYILKSEYLPDIAYITYTKYITEKIIEKIIHHGISIYEWVDTSRILLSKRFLKKHNHSLYWEHASGMQELSESEIIEYDKLLCWQIISRHQKMSFDLIMRFIDKIDMIALKKNAKVSSHIYNNVLLKLYIDCKKSRNFDNQIYNSLFLLIEGYNVDVDLFIDKVDWRIVSQNIKLGANRDILYKYVDKIYFDKIPESAYVDIDIKIVNCLRKKLNFAYVCKYIKISHKFLRFYKRHFMIEWKIISRRKLTEHIIKDFIHWLDMDSLCLYQTMSEKFISKPRYFNRFNLDRLVEGQKLSETFLLKVVDRVSSVNILFINQKLSVAFMQKYAKYIDWDEMHIDGSCNIPEDVICNNFGTMSWYNISRHGMLSEAFMRKYAHKLFWTFICEYQTLSEDFIEEMSCIEGVVGRIHWPKIARFQKLSEEFILRHYDKMALWNVEGCKYITKEYIDEFDVKYDIV